MQTQNGLVTVKEAADILGVHENTILRYIKNGALPVIRFGRALRIKKDDLLKYAKPEKES